MFVYISKLRQAPNFREETAKDAAMSESATSGVWWSDGKLMHERRPNAYIRSGALMPISSKERRNTIWADSTSFSRAAVIALSLS